MDNSQLEGIIDEITQRVINQLENSSSSIKTDRIENKILKEQFKVIGGEIPTSLMNEIEHNDSADDILITNLTVNQLLRLSHLIALNKEEEHIVSALLKNNLVIALKVENYNVNNRYLNSKLQEAKKRLSEYGLKYSSQNQLIDDLNIIKNKRNITKNKKENYRSNHFLTIKEVESRLNDNSMLYLEENEYLTPMAKDFIKHQNIKVY